MEKRKRIRAAVCTVLVLIVGLTLFLVSIQNEPSIAFGQIGEVTRSDGIRSTASEKQQFASEMAKQYQEACGAGKIQPSSGEEVQNLILQSILADTSHRDELVAELEAHGVYRMPSKTDSTKSADVTLYEPMLFFHAAENTWILATGGHWNNENWGYSLFHKYIGDADTFGVHFTEKTDGTYRSYVKSARATICDKENQKSETSFYRSDGDGALGFRFSMQDYAKSTFRRQNNYVGYRWAGCVTYDARFAEYEFAAESYYYHTYNKG